MKLASIRSLSYFRQVLTKFPRISKYIVDIIHPKISQEQLDYYNASALLYAYTNTSLSSEAIYDRIDSMSSLQRQQFAQIQCDVQIRTLFTSLHNLTTQYNTDIHTIYTNAKSSEDVKIPSNLQSRYKQKISRNLNKTHLSTPSIDYTNVIKNSIGFELRFSPSTIAGNGVFVNGDIKAGTVVALFGGQVHVLQHLTEKYLYDNGLLPDTHLSLFARTDGHVIDGNSTSSCAFNPIALAQLVNHPSHGLKPNVLAVSLILKKLIIIYF
jgi:hypothetical protein